MATRKASAETTEATEIAWDDPSVLEAYNTGDSSKLPPGVTIASPYGKQPDVGTGFVTSVPGDQDANSDV
jgi:hypothetical protein